ncbi:GNAT family acetyltransferase [Suillus subaureus]|uniref:GNAT family acetyltransferase n=1 Tax=Suillus subaureus TaxID=48587 RepID=A0A9P7JKJ0_9AGAM|nr:GNAT family acetyltransferase [Suillus subaureus]KAG1827367.1 GNAT family acetyltransferase [Suillus subaureus]
MIVSKDLNFCFPVRELSNERVKMTPFKASIHSSPFFSVVSAHPELWAHMSSGPFETVQDFDTNFLGAVIHRDPGTVLFAIIDKTKPPSAADGEGELAGMISYMHSSSVNLSTEIGCVIILPPYQRTHVNSNAVGLLLQYALEVPSQGGLGLRRVQWQCSSVNAPSIRAAERLGFKKEAIMRWYRVYRGGKERGKVHNGRELPQGDLGEQDYGLDLVIFGYCWDDWEQGGRENIQAIMNRQHVSYLVGSPNAAPFR